MKNLCDSCTKTEENCDADNAVIARDVFNLPDVEVKNLDNVVACKSFNNNIFIYLVQATYGSYDDFYEMIISVRPTIEKAEQDAKKYEEYVEKIRSKQCPLSEKEIEYMFHNYDTMDEEKIKIYSDWEEEQDRVAEFGRVKIVPIVYDMLLTNLE